MRPKSHFSGEENLDYFRVDIVAGIVTAAICVALIAILLKV